MKKVAIDIDDTITDTSETLFNYLSKYEKVNLNDPLNNKLDIMRGKITCPELLDFYKEYAVLIADTVQMKSGVKKGLEFLKENSFEIHILSGRILDTQDATVNYFNRNELPYDYIKVNVYNKKEYCKENNIDFIIDDAIETCQEIKDTNTIPILFNSIINEEIDNGDIIRINSWEELQLVINSLE